MCMFTWFRQLDVILFNKAKRLFVIPSRTLVFDCLCVCGRYYQADSVTHKRFAP